MNVEEIKKVFTPLGKGRIVYRLGDGSYVVEFDHGGGHIFRADELFRSEISGLVTLTEEDCDGREEGWN